MKLRIPLKSVIVRHILTYDTASKRERVNKALVWLLFPLPISAVLCFSFGMEVNTLSVNTLITVMAIFIPLLFTALISLHDTRQTIRSRIDLHPSETTKLEYLLVKYENLADNVSFILAVSILEIVLLLISMCMPRLIVNSMTPVQSRVLVSIFSTLVIYMLQIILFHIVFVVERLASLIKVTTK